MGAGADKKYPELIRRIKYIDPETGKRLVFLTNNMTVPAETIALLYKNRWRDINSYVPYNRFGTDNFSIRTTGCNTLVVLNFKQKSNGRWRQHVTFNDERIRNILATMRNRFLEYVELLDDIENENDADADLEKLEEVE